MAGITQAQAEAQLTAWLAALDAIAQNQSYTINGRSLTRANLSDVKDMVDYWDGKVKALTPGGGRRVRLGTPT